MCIYIYIYDISIQGSPCVAQGAKRSIFTGGTLHPKPLNLTTPKPQTLKP